MTRIDEPPQVSMRHSPSPTLAPAPHQNRIASWKTMASRNVKKRGKHLGYEGVEQLLRALLRPFEPLFVNHSQAGCQVILELQDQERFESLEDIRIFARWLVRLPVPQSSEAPDRAQQIDRCCRQHFSLCFSGQECAAGNRLGRARHLKHRVARTEDPSAEA
jgi:hypothetical protein